MIDRTYQLKIGILAAQCHQPASHAASRAMNHQAYSVVCHDLSSIVLQTSRIVTRADEQLLQAVPVPRGMPLLKELLIATVRDLLARLNSLGTSRGCRFLLSGSGVRPGERIVRKGRVKVGQSGAVFVR